ncbi:MAG: aminotransferase class V-fold PLP-dependent enzyme [Acidimicrobiales bacterium]
MDSVSFVGPPDIEVTMASTQALTSSVLDPSHDALLPVVGADQMVPTVGGDTVPYVNFDTAASAPCLESVWATVGELLPWYSSVHRGAGFLSQVTTSVLESARRTVSEFLGAPAEMSVMFTRNTTDAINLLSSALPSGTSVITYASEHHANLLPWRRHQAAVLTVPSTAEETLEVTASAMRAARKGPLLLAVTGASNVTGEIWPLAELVRLAHAHGAQVIVDAAQLAPHRAINLAALGADYLAISGHKLYAPFGAGALVGRPDWLDAAQPYLCGGGAVRHVSVDNVTWLTGPARHEAGTPNLVGIAALAAACNSLAGVGMDNVARHEAGLLERLLEGLHGLASTVYSMWPPGHDHVGVVSFNLDGFTHGKLAAILSAEYGIGVRDGSFCAHPLVDQLTAKDRSSGGAVRASLGVSSNIGDVDRLLDALRRIVTEGPAWCYRLVSGRYVPEPDTRPRPRIANLDI